MSYEVDPTPRTRRWRGISVQIPVKTTQVSPPTQPAFDFDQAARPVQKTDLTIEQRFLDWCQANPGILRTLRQMALARVAAGETRISTKELIEDLRRSGPSINSGREPYKINNIFTSRLSRVLNDDPRLAGLIELRALKAE
jgi:hypothetical protein